MTSQRDLERTLDTYFEIGADEVADRVIDAALLTIEHAPQRRAGRVPWRFPDMSSSLKLVTAATVVVVAVGGAAWMLGRGIGTPGVGGGPSPTVSATPPPSVAPSTAQSSSPATSTVGWNSFSSTRYGYDLSYPVDWTSQQSTRAWSFEVDKNDWLTNAADRFRGQSLLVTAFRADLPVGTSGDEWITSYHSLSGGSGSPKPCAYAPVDLGTKQVDGHAVSFWRETGEGDCAGTAAFVVVDDRMFVFTIWRENQQPMLEALLSTVTFRP